MKKILFVEDNNLISRIYSQKLADLGFSVTVAEDGIEAMRLLPEIRPDLVVLDLLMPRMTGADVLKYIRQHPELKATPVIVFSNSFLSNLVEQISHMKVEATLVKATVNPTRLAEIINETLQKPAASGSPDKQASAAPLPPRPTSLPPTKAAKPAPAAPSPARSTSLPPAKVSKPAPARSIVPGPSRPTTPPPSIPNIPPPASPTRTSPEPTKNPGAESDQDFTMRIGMQFLERSPILFNELRAICRDFLEAAKTPAEADHLAALNRKLGFLTQITGMAGYQKTAELSSALEAFVFELANKPVSLTDSARQTIASTISFLAERLERADPPAEAAPGVSTALIVDDDAVSNLAAERALARAKFSVTSVTEPLKALEKLERNPYDALLLDIAMPGMDGFALCEKARRLPLHKRTPVIFITGSTDFNSHARSILSGGNDLITKPISPNELCVKVITHLLKGSYAR